LPSLDAQTLTLAPLHQDQDYALVPEAGLREAQDQEPALSGADWKALQDALGERLPFTAALRTIAGLPPGGNSALRNQLRVLLNYHCGVATLRTRQLMRDLQAL
jgi:DNA repair protein RecO (recombination protein O)